MKPLNSFKENNKHHINSLATVPLKKIQMNLDDNGVKVRIFADCLKKGNHTVIVQDGMLYLKVKPFASTYDFYRNPFLAQSFEKDMDFQIRLPGKQYRYLHAMRFHKGVLEVRVGEHHKINQHLKTIKPSLAANQLMAS